ncbi:MAG TPA: homoserine kinase [Anaerolineales bacterium]|nr:homoserine kinase [Anaerolineales bacterium]
MIFTIKVPATSANLGPGFDTLGLALDLWNETTITPAKEFSAQVSGEGAGRLASGKNNLLVRAAQRVAERAGDVKGRHIGLPLPPFHAECANRIPLSSGMGSSSAAILTGLLAGNALLENPFSREEILNLACEMEGHPDNVAPAMMGGLVVSTVEDRKVIARRIPIMGEQGGHIGPPQQITIALPDFYLPTKQARAALPKKVSMRNAIHNISRTALVIEAFRNGDLDLLGKVMSDKLHQPYRLKLISGAASAMEAAKEAGASAVALSGAGPSVIAFSMGEAGIGESMKRAYEAAGVEARIFRLGVASRGAELEKRE